MSAGMIRTGRVLTLLVLFATVPEVSLAQDGSAPGRYPLRGLSIGFRYHSSWIGSEEPPPGAETGGLYVERSGAGVTLGIGYPLASTLGLRLVLGSAVHKTSQEGVEALHSTVAFEIDRRFRSGERFQPYLLGGLGAAAVRIDADSYESSIHGGVALFGAGALLGLTESVFIDGSARLDLINWSQVRVTHQVEGSEDELIEPLEESVRAFKVQIGIVWDLGWRL